MNFIRQKDGALRIIDFAIWPNGNDWKKLLRSNTKLRRLAAQWTKAKNELKALDVHDVWDDVCQKADELGIPAFEGVKNLSELLETYPTFENLGAYTQFLDEDDEPVALWVAAE